MGIGMAKQKQKEVWDSIAEGWTHWRSKPMKQVDEFAGYINKKTKKRKLRILDVGCGNCRNMVPFKNHNLYGIDFAKNMIKEARKICIKEDIKPKLKIAQIRNLHFNRNYFDVVVCTAVLQCLEKDREKAVDEIFRVLKPGGFALFSTWKKPGKREQYLPWKRRKIQYLRHLCHGGCNIFILH